MRAAHATRRNLRRLPEKAAGFRAHLAVFSYAFPLDSLVQQCKYAHASR
jgi:predicted amidophosphoribosyltransferase